MSDYALLLIGVKGPENITSQLNFIANFIYPNSQAEQLFGFSC